jgi:predicted dehydrogenase
VLIGIPAVNFKGPAVADSQPPAELDYDFWLGPAPSKPYNEKHVHYNFRFFWDYSGGQMTNFGAHHIDIAHWALGMDNSGPVAVEGTATFDPTHTYEVTRTCRVTFTYENGTRLVVGQEQKDVPQGVTFIGSYGKIFVDRKKITSEPKEIVGAGPDIKGKYPDMNDVHKKNFVDCLKSRELPICDVEIGHRSATVCHLGNIAVRLGRKLRWDPSVEQIIGDAEANTWLDRPKRAPYML